MKPIELPWIRLILSYLGTGFHGWQSQADGSGIQDALEKALATYLRETVRVTSSSRTDTGVHAEYQVVTFRTEQSVDLHKLVRGLNALLPKTVRVRHAQVVPNDFHPILSAKAKVYRYRVWRPTGENPFVAPFVWAWSQPLDLAAMTTAAKLLIGEHDFTSFCSVDSSAKTKVRNVMDIRVLDHGPLLEFWFLGEGFLKQMVRTMVGTIMAVGQGKLAIDAIPRILAAKDRRVAASTAPAEGLCLVRVCYDDVPSLDALLAEAQRGYNVPLGGEWSGM